MQIYVTKFSETLTQKTNTAKGHTILHFGEHTFDLYLLWIECMFVVFSFFISLCKVRFLREHGSVTNRKIIKIVEVISWVFLTQI